jgi:hypothetical protein
MRLSHPFEPFQKSSDSLPTVGRSDFLTTLFRGWTHRLYFTVGYMVVRLDWTSRSGNQRGFELGRAGFSELGWFWPYQGGAVPDPL